MKLQKSRWSRVYESAEEELINFLSDHKVTAKRVHIDEFGQLEQSPSVKETTIWCAEGSLQIQVYGTNTPLQPGDSVKLPENTLYTLAGGFSGAVIYIA